MKIHNEKNLRIPRVDGKRISEDKPAGIYLIPLGYAYV